MMEMKIVNATLFWHLLNCYKTNRWNFVLHSSRENLESLSCEFDWYDIFVLVKLRWSKVRSFLLSIVFRETGTMNLISDECRSRFCWYSLSFKQWEIIQYIRVLRDTNGLQGLARSEDAHWLHRIKHYHMDRLDILRTHSVVEKHPQKGCGQFFNFSYQLRI